MSVASTKFAYAAFALVEVLIVVAAIALHIAIICVVLALPIVRIKAAALAQPLKLTKSTRAQIEQDVTTLAARTRITTASVSGLGVQCGKRDGRALDSTGAGTAGRLDP